jgi:hypothetical protein
MILALFYLQFHTIKNRLWVRLRRLKQPKYLAGAIVGGLYFYFYFFRWMFLRAGGAAAGPSRIVENTGMYESVAALVLMILVLLNWILPRERAALAFSEAEVAFLFPAPVSRQGLIHYKLLRSQFAILFSTLFLALLSGRFAAGGNVWIRIAGWWLILSTLNLHFLGASFARTLLLERGISNWQRRATVLAILLVLTVVTILWSRQSVRGPRLEDLSSVRVFASYLTQLSQSGPAPYLFFPFRIVVRPYLASNAHAFLLNALPVLGILAMHYWWVIRSNVAFEEASVELSRKIALRIAAARAGRLQPSGNGKAKAGKRPPFQLGSTGFPPVALLWKNLIAAGQVFTLRFWLLLLWLLAIASFVVASAIKDSGLLPAISFFCLMLITMSLVIGPQLLRQDFRQDLAMADILKMYPLRGWQVALGELLAPATILTGLQWSLLVAAVGLCSRVSSETEIPLTTRLALGSGAAVLLPMLNLISLLIPNLAVLLFPSWVQTDKDSPQGIEATGQRLIFMLGQLLVFIVALLPAALAFGAVFLVANYLVGWVAAVPPASLAAAVALAVESMLGLLLLGRLFERLDVSAEPAS